MVTIEQTQDGKDSFVTEITPPRRDFSKVVTRTSSAAQLADYSRSRAVCILRPYGTRIWDAFSRPSISDKPRGHSTPTFSSAAHPPRACEARGRAASKYLRRRVAIRPAGRRRRSWRKAGRAPTSRRSSDYVAPKLVRRCSTCAAMITSGPTGSLEKVTRPFLPHY